MKPYTSHLINSPSILSFLFELVDLTNMHVHFRTTVLEYSQTNSIMCERINNGLLGKHGVLGRLLIWGGNSLKFQSAYAPIII